MSGINYDLSKIRGLAFDVDGVLSPGTIPMRFNGEPMRKMNVKDGYALQLARKQGLEIAIITGGKSGAVRKRYEALGITDIYQGCSIKLDVFERWMEARRLTPEETVYMGDDIPDLQCLRKAGLACCPFDASTEAKMSSTYVSRFTGGHGCVRDVLEQVMKARDLWLADDDAFGW